MSIPKFLETRTIQSGCQFLKMFLESYLHLYWGFINCRQTPVDAIGSCTLRQLIHRETLPLHVPVLCG